MNIHEYANDLICIILLQFEEQFMRLHVIPIRLFQINYQQRFDLISV
jgi:hypothetical protein